MFTFQKFQQCAAATELSDKQIQKITAKLAIHLSKYNNNPNISLEYLLRNLKADPASVLFSSNDNPSRPLVFIDINFMLDATLIETRVTAEFNNSSCYIPYTYSHFNISVQHTERSGLYDIFDIYRPQVGTSYFYFAEYDKECVCTVSVRDAFKFSHYFSPIRNRFHIEYKMKKGKLFSSSIINDENDDYVSYKNKLLSAEAETSYINFANLAYTKDSDWVNSFVKNSINFTKMDCFAELKTIFLSLYEGEHRERMINELKIFEMYYI